MPEQRYLIVNRQVDPYKGEWTNKDAPPTYRNAAFTSGLTSTTNDQIPDGRPRRQHMQLPGISATLPARASQ